jgi:hypothetical protein
VSVTPISPGEKEIPVTPELAALANDERWQLVTRISASLPFVKSPRLRNFLVFICERSLTGHVEEITEYEIGWKVFERGEKYSPSDDSIVRTAARQLRAKVKEYFESEGAGEAWSLEIPKGGYIPIFTKRETAIVEEYVPPAPPAPAPPLVDVARRWQYVSAALAVVAIGALVTAVWLWRAARAETPAPSIVSAVLARGPQATRVVVGDFGIVLMEMANRRNVSVEDYINRSYVNTLPATPSEPFVRNLWNVFSLGQIVSFPDVAAVSAIMRLSGAEGRKAIVQDARQITARDLRSGNFILLSAPVASPWMTLFEDKLNFRYRVSFEKNSPSMDTAFENLHPQPGEKPVYRADATTPGYGVTYGLVAKVPNLTGTGKVLLLYGLKYTGLEAAGEYATDPKTAAALAELLHVRNIEDAPDFEVLIETYAIDTAPRYVKVAALRAIK